MECLLSASVTGHLALFPCRCELFAFCSVPSTKSLAFFAFPLSFALSESVSVDSFPNDERRRLFCSLACWQALYRPWLFEAISQAFSLASYASFFGMASLVRILFYLPCRRILPWWPHDLFCSGTNRRTKEGVVFHPAASRGDGFHQLVSWFQLASRRGSICRFPRISFWIRDLSTMISSFWIACLKSA